MQGLSKVYLRIISQLSWFRMTVRVYWLPGGGSKPIFRGMFVNCRSLGYFLSNDALNALYDDVSRLCRAVRYLRPPDDS